MLGKKQPPPDQPDNKIQLWRNNGKRLLVAILLISFSVLAEAEDDEITKEIFNNVADEYTQCGSYFAIIADAAMKNGDTQLEENYKKSSTQALELAMVAAKVGRSQEMAQKVTLARLDMSLLEMTKLIENDYSNISLLLSKYASRCLDMMEKSN